MWIRGSVVFTVSEFMRWGLRTWVGFGSLKLIDIWVGLLLLELDGPKYCWAIKYLMLNV